MIGRCLTLVVFASCALAVSGHLCLIEPHQRGSMTDINTPGAKDCELTSSPCGGRGLGKFIVAKGGANFTVVFQKNLDHYNKATPGYFSLGLATYPSTSFKEVARVADMGEPSLHLYITDVPLPPGDNMMHTLQVMYKTNNPQAPAAFYQCADMATF